MATAWLRASDSPGLSAGSAPAACTAADASRHAAAAAESISSASPRRSGTSRVDKSLLTAIARAHSWRRAIELGQVRNVDELAAREKIDRTELREILRLAFLAPDIQKSIIESRQPARLSLKSLIDLDLPFDWRAQREMLGLERGRIS